MTRPTEQVMRENCLLCGAVRPPGHVIVREHDYVTRVGRVCSSHTLSEVIMDRQERFDIDVWGERLWEEETNETE